MPILETWQDYQDEVLLSGIGGPMSEFMGRVFVRNMAAFGLSRAEKAVAQQIRRGLSNKEIVVALRLSEHTIKNHITSALAKTGAQDRLQLVLRLYGLDGVR